MKSYNVSHSRFSAISALLLIIAMLVYCPHAHAAISEAEARAAAYQYCEEQFAYPKNSQEIYEIFYRDEGGWSFGIRVLEEDGTVMEYVRGEMDKNGKLLSLNKRGDITLNEQLQDDLRRCARSYEDMYAFKQKWERRLGQGIEVKEASKGQRDEPDRRQNAPLTALIRHDIRLPSPADISYEDAKKKSEEAILALPGWTREMLDHLRISLEVYHVPVGSDRPVYEFVYRVASSVGHVEAIVSGIDYDATYDRLEKAETRIFGQAIPWNVNVRIDAQTGEQASDIYVDIPPTRYRDSDFILWKWDGTP